MVPDPVVSFTVNTYFDSEWRTDKATLQVRMIARRIYPELKVWKMEVQGVENRAPGASVA